MSSNNVIVFGPTGHVGSVTARVAQEHGAKVFLAMRDTQKSIPGLSREQEKAGGYERVQADLLKSDTVADAVRKSGAKAAFIYIAMGQHDGMKSTIEALKSAGVEFIVFLSSYTVDMAPPKDIQPQELIPYIHAQVEINLESIYGPENYVALRPGSFATNVTWWNSMIRTGEVKLLNPEVKFDYITFTDMGRVAGSLLAKGQQQDGVKHITLFGPRPISQKDAVALISKALQKDLKVTTIDEEEYIKIQIDAGLPEVIARYIGGKLGSDPNYDISSKGSYYKDAVDNITKFGGKAPTQFSTWLAENKDLLA